MEIQSKQPQLTAVAKSICKDQGFTLIGFENLGTYKETFHVKARGGESLALKVYKQGSLEERDNREIRAMQSCDHPNVARIFTFNRQNIQGTNYFYTTEEFLPGGTLSDKLAKGLLEKLETVRLGSSIIDAIGHFKSKNFVHRDIKPDNILFREDGHTPVIVDFGTVRQLDAEAITAPDDWRSPGTAYYSSPEQLNNSRDVIDFRSDQFTVGVVLSMCAFGRHPHVFSGEGSPVNRVANHKPPTDAFVYAANAAGLAALIKMLSPWPHDRYRTPELLLQAWNDQG